MAQIRVNNGLTKPKGIHVYNSTAKLWENNKIGYVRVNGEWIPFIQYQKWIYKDGITDYVFNEVKTSGDGRGDINYLTTEINLRGQAQWVNSQVPHWGSGLARITTPVPINVTDFSKLNVQFSIPIAFTSGRGSGRLIFGLSTKSNGNPYSVHKSFSIPYGSTDALNEELDISGTQGSLYVFVAFENLNETSWREARIKKIWLE